MKPLEPADLDPQIAAALRERLHRLVGRFDKATPLPETPEWQRTVDLMQSVPRPPWSPGSTAVALATGAALLLVGIGTLVLAQKVNVGDLGFVISVGVLMGAMLSLMTNLVVDKALARRDVWLRPYFRPEVVDALVPTLSLTPIESVYVAGVVALLEAQGALGAAITRELLTSQNALVEIGRRLEKERQSLDSALGDDTIERVAADVEALEGRIAQATDLKLRETLRERQAQRRLRLEQVRTLSPLRERIEVQWEGIAETLRSTQATLAGLRYAPEPEERLDDVRSAAREMGNRTRAIEEAIQEVRALRG